MPIPDLTLWCTRAAAAHRCGVDESTVSRWIRKGRLKTYAPRCSPKEKVPILLLCSEVDAYCKARLLVTGGG